MAWNESGGNNNQGGNTGGSPGGNRNPWGKRPQQGPPDLDQVLRNLQRKFAGFFGGGKKPPSGDARGGGSGGVGFGVVILVALLVWGLTGVYQVDQAERGIVFRFGKYYETTQPGLNWRIPWPVDSKTIINIERIDPFTDETRMLTADENMVDITMAVQFRRADPKLYVFNVRDPDVTLREVSESAIRETIGRSKLADVLESGRQKISDDTKELIQRILNFYQVGIEVESVSLPDVKVPEQVKTAQEDSIKAGKDKERLVSEAQTYANDILPKARGDSARLVQDAQAYRARKIADSSGETERFSKLLSEYERAPAITRERLYLETLQEVLGKSKKIVIDAKGSGNMLYLPIDKLMEQRTQVREPSRDTIAVTRAPQPTTTDDATDDHRARGSR
jgi:modulator of FtsH protease HflK